MAYSPGQSAPITPPPPMGGNRNTQHIVAGQTHNVGYAAGQNLANARTLYQQGAAGQRTFRNQASIRPQFNYQGPTPNTAQSVGNQMRANTEGAIRPQSSPAGMMNYMYASEPVRQHIIPTADGFEYGGIGLKPITAPNPVAPPPPNTTTPTTTTGSTASSTTTQPTGLSPTQQTIQDNGGKGTELVNSTTNITAQKLASQRTEFNSQIHSGRIKISANPPLWAPLMKPTAAHPKGYIDPTWRAWMDAAGIKAPNETIDSTDKFLNKNIGTTQTTSAATSGIGTVAAGTAAPVASTAVTQGVQAAPAANTPAPVPVQQNWTLQQAIDAWNRNHMGARTFAGGTQRTPAWTAFLKKHGVI